MPRDVTKTERIIVRATPEETDMLAALSEQTGLSMSDVVRQLIRQSPSRWPRAAPKRGSPTARATGRA
jgi:hypothetical protein